FPHLARTKFRIEKLLDERSFNGFLADIACAPRTEFFQDVQYGLENGKAFDTLRSPLGADFAATDPPDLFRIGFEKREIEFASESIDKELLEIRFGPNGGKRRAQITEADTECLRETQFAQRIDAERDRIGEELPHEVDARFTGTQKHHEVRMRGIRPRSRRRQAGDLVLILHWRARGRSGIERKNIQPPLHDAIGFGEKAMAADID